MPMIETLTGDTTIFESLLGDTFIQTRRTRLPDGMGGWSISHLAMGTIDGRLRPASAEEITVALQEQRKITHKFYCLAGTDIARGDRVVGENRTLDVVGVREPAHAGHHLEVDLYEVQKEETDAGS